MKSTKFFFLSCLLLLTALPCAAQLSVEIPGNGIDDTQSYTAGSCPAGFRDAEYSSGCDRNMPAIVNDDDLDGDPNDADCDPQNKLQHEGTYSTEGCSAGEAKFCSGGSYGACTTISSICEATNGGQCFWIDCVSGSDSTGNGTFANPWASGGMVSGGATGAPAGAIVPDPGDVVYVKTGCSTQFGTPGTFIEVRGSGKSVAAIAYDAEASGPFSNGETLTFSGGATATLESFTDNGSTGTLNVSFTAYPIPEDNETITGGTSGASALVNGSVSPTVHYITYRNWPGEDFATFSAASGQMFYAATGNKFIQIRGWKYSIANSGTNKPFDLRGARETKAVQLTAWKFRDLWVYDSTGSGNENFGGGVFAQHQTDFDIANIFCENISTTAGTNFINSACVTLINDHDAPVPEGRRNFVRYMVHFSDSWASSNSGTLFLKHGIDAMYADGIRAEWIHSINAKYLNVQEGSGLSLRRAYVYNEGATSQLFYVNDGGSSSPRYDNKYQFITAVGVKDGTIREIIYDGLNRLEVLDSVLIGNTGSYGEGTSMFNIETYGSAQDKIDMLAQNVLNIDRNTYWDTVSSSALRFNFFGGGQGGVYTLTDWRTQTGEDANSIIVDPNLDADGMPQAATARGGWLATSAEQLSTVPLQSIAGTVSADDTIQQVGPMAIQALVGTISGTPAAGSTGLMPGIMP